MKRNQSFYQLLGEGEWKNLLPPARKVKGYSQVTIQTAFTDTRKDRHLRGPRRPDHEDLQLFSMGKYISPARILCGPGGKLALSTIDTRTEYEKMRELHTGEIK